MLLRTQGTLPTSDFATELAARRRALALSDGTQIPASVFLPTRDDWGPIDENGLDWPSADALPHASGLPHAA